MRTLPMLITVMLLGCNPYKDYLTNDTICDFDSPIFKLKEDEKSFDVEKYKKIIDSISKIGEDFVLFDNEELRSSIYAWTHDKGITKTIVNKGNGISKITTYDSLGKITSFANDHSKYESDFFEKRILFNTDGTVKKSTNYRQADNYPICYREALNVVTDKKGKKDSITGLSRTTFAKNDKEYYVWEVFTEVPKRLGKGKSHVYRVDAQSGKIMSKGVTRIVHP